MTTPRPTTQWDGQHDRDQLASDLVVFLDHWDASDDVNSHQMDEAADLARRALALADPTDTSRYQRLGDAIDYWESLDEHDLSAAIDLIDATTSTL